MKLYERHLLVSQAAPTSILCALDCTPKAYPFVYSPVSVSIFPSVPRFRRDARREIINVELQSWLELPELKLKMLGEQLKRAWNFHAPT